MLLARSPAVARRVFIFCNAVFIAVMYHRIDDALHFFLMAGGLVTFSFFLLKAIRQIIGD